MVHLVLAALGAVAGQTQSLVGQELVGAGVDGGTDSNTTVMMLAFGVPYEFRGPGNGRQKSRKTMLVCLRDRADEVR